MPLNPSFKKIVKLAAKILLLVVVLTCFAAAAYRYIGRAKVASAYAIRTADGVELVEPITIGGIQQWIEVRGQSASNPILLFIHGGPGSAFMPIARSFQQPWEKYFTIVQWDQRGAGKTYTANSKDILRATMTMERMHADTLEVVNFLRNRYKRDKIFVLGHSWGSILGLQLAHDHPELLYAYVGVGQAINSLENEEVLYKDTLAEAHRTGNKKAIEELNSIAPYPSPSITFEQVRTMRQWSGALIGPPAADEGESLMSMKTLFFAPEYSLLNDADWFRGQLFSIDMLLPGLSKVNLADLGYEYRVPIFMLEGRHDPYTPSSVAKEFFDKVNAPDKQFVWFEKSGHFPFAEEPSEFTAVLTQKVLPLAAGH